MKYIYNLDVFLNESALSYYLLGVFVTDGCIHEYSTKKNVSLTSKDKDWLVMIRDLICPEMTTRYYNGAWSFVIHSTKLANWFISKNCTPRKSLTLKAPIIPDEFYPDFIRGCIDGDGTLGIYDVLDKRSKKNKFNKQIVCGLVSASKDFITDVMKILHLNDHTCTFFEEKKNRKNSLYTIKFSGRKTYNFLKWIYYPSTPLSMPRKMEIAKEILNYYDNKGADYINRDSNNLSGEVNPNSKLKETEVCKILQEWFQVSETERVKYGYKTLYFKKNIKNKYCNCSYAMFRDITSGKAWGKTLIKIKKENFPEE
jgi:hypothetical protein